MDSELLSEVQAGQYQRELINKGENGFIRQIDFEGADSPFDTSELSVDRDYSHEYPRVLLIK